MMLELKIFYAISDFFEFFSRELITWILFSFGLNGYILWGYLRISVEDWEVVVFLAGLLILLYKHRIENVHVLGQVPRLLHHSQIYRNVLKSRSTFGKR